MLASARNAKPATRAGFLTWFLSGFCCHVYTLAWIASGSQPDVCEATNGSCALLLTVYSSPIGSDNAATNGRTKWQVSKQYRSARLATTNFAQ